MDIVQGRTSAAATDTYNHRFVFRDLGIETFGSLSYALFNEGRDGILVGRNGWLFTSEEFQSDSRSPQRTANAIDFIASARDQLKRNGVELVVALLPSKARIYNEQLPTDGLPEEIAARYQHAIKELGAREVRVVDLEASLRAAKGKGQVFLRTDTHWTPLGASAAAQSLAAELEKDEVGDEGAFASLVTGSLAHKGDLMRYIRVLPVFESLRPHEDELVEVEAMSAQAASAGDLFGDVGVPVTLVGTSYSANARFGFEAHLKAAIGSDVLNRAQEGGGPFKPMRAYLEEMQTRKDKPRVVIWEIPERYLDDADENAVSRLEEK
jgi:alginate O-acetyltransferase complex protein AlgJ